MNNFNMHYVLNLDAIQEIIIASNESDCLLDKGFFKSQIVKNIGLDICDQMLDDIMTIANFWHCSNNMGSINRDNYHEITNWVNTKLDDIYQVICKDIDWEEIEYRLEQSYNY